MVLSPFKTSGGPSCWGLACWIFWKALYARCYESCIQCSLSVKRQGMKFDWSPKTINNPLKTNMTLWKIPTFNRKYIFEWWIFSCHSFVFGEVNPEMEVDGRWIFHYHYPHGISQLKPQNHSRKNEKIIFQCFICWQLCFSGWCSTPILLLSCWWFSRENPHPLVICSSLSTAQFLLISPETILDIHSVCEISGVPKWDF